MNRFLMERLHAAGRCLDLKAGPFLIVNLNLHDPHDLHDLQDPHDPELQL